mmetsp:Transcript_54893/g.163411  ORF Transcript_54893/g.163411 Transcript_54893/m.163411 type:complete len:282 (-) Transcript_54893:2-847(-)
MPKAIASTEKRQLGKSPYSLAASSKWFRTVSLSGQVAQVPNSGTPPHLSSHPNSGPNHTQNEANSLCNLECLLAAFSQKCPPTRSRRSNTTKFEDPSFNHFRPVLMPWYPAPNMPIGYGHWCGSALNDFMPFTVTCLEICSTSLWVLSWHPCLYTKVSWCTGTINRSESIALTSCTVVHVCTGMTNSSLEPSTFSVVCRREALKFRPVPVPASAHSGAITCRPKDCMTRMPLPSDEGSGRSLQGSNDIWSQQPPPGTQMHSFRPPPHHTSRGYETPQRTPP